MGATIRSVYPQLSNSGTGGPSLWNFAYEMREGDLVIVKAAGRFIHIAEVAGPYEWRETSVLEGDDYHHQRQVIITDRDPARLWQDVGAGFAKGQSSQWTVALCGGERT
jgi:hypothetical protein